MSSLKYLISIVLAVVVRVHPVGAFPVFKTEAGLVALRHPDPVEVDDVEVREDLWLML